ncbi:MAG: ammonium transporter [Candidatus Caenarcaniphilales bacterium]|nr:ammonium transporter [Candidatus Caenarcaniphilales bacterium]
MEILINSSWMLVSSSYVFFMIIGLAFFYAGLVRTKNALNTMMMSFISIGIVSITWALIGYSLAYGNYNLFHGGFEFAFLNGINLEGEKIPKVLDFVFQGTFAIITAALISGSIVERMSFRAYMLFIAIWSILVYAPMTKWVWGGGLFHHLPTGQALDFAGGTVVHINAAISAIVLATLVGKRKDIGRVAMLPHQVPFTLLGVGILWFGWFGFNGGSAYGPNAQAALAMINSLLSPAAAIVGWAIMDGLYLKKVTAVGLATSIVVGLVAITPAAGFVSPTASILIGLITTLPCYYAIMWRSKSGFDDSLDVFGAHGLGGIVGSILTGVFVSKAWGGPVDASMNQIITQITAVAIAIVYSALATAIIALSIKIFMPLRAEEKQEKLGLDITLHGEEAYSEGEGAVLITVK